MAKNDYTQKQTNKNNSENTQKNQSKNSTKESTSELQGQKQSVRQVFEGCNADKKRSRRRTGENPGAPAPFWVRRNFGAFSLTAHRKCPYNKKNEKSKKRCRGKDASA